MSTTNALSSLSGAVGGTGTGTSAGAGLGAGINVQQFVQFAVANQTAHITAMQAQQTTLGSEAGKLASITSELTALGNAAAVLRDPLGALAAEVATSSNSNILTATASGIALASAHTISITSLATTSSYYSDAVTSSSTVLAIGDTISISVGGKAVTSVTVDSTNNTLDQLVAAINDSTTGVQANVINDANGARLAIVSTTSGVPGDVGVTGSLHLTDAGNTAVNFHQAAQGLNAQLNVDGVPISSTTNTVSGVINGVTLNLGAPTGATPVTLKVASDTTQATSAINTFVAAYNTVVNDITSQFKVNPDGSGGGVLDGDNSLREAQSLLLGAVSHAISGNNGVVNLSSIGINLQNDGTLTVDTAKLGAALTTKQTSVQNLFGSAAGSFSQNLSATISSLTASATGILSLDSQSITSTSLDLTRQINDLQAALVTQEASLTAVYAKVNATLQQLPLLQSQIAQQLAAA
jgi:flagellar hook-associated protein 2